MTSKQQAWSIAMLATLPICVLLIARLWMRDNFENWSIIKETNVPEKMLMLALLVVIQIFVFLKADTYLRRLIFYPIAIINLIGIIAFILIIK